MGLQSFPKLTIPDSDKDEQWHKDYAKTILASSVGNDYDFVYTVMDECYRFFSNMQTDDEFDFLMTTETGDALPAIFIQYNSIRNRVRNLVSELSARGFSISVDAQNKEAKSRKLKTKNDALAKLDIKPFLQEAEMMTGIPQQMPTGLPREVENEDDVDEYFKNGGYKDKSEIVMKAALNYVSRKMNYETLRMQLFRDIIIAGRAFCKTEVFNGMPFCHRVDPRMVIFDNNCQDDFISDCTYFGEMRYVSLADAIETYDLSNDEIEQIQMSSNSNQGTYFAQSARGVSHIGQSTSVNYVERNGSQTKILILYAEWEDTKVVRRKKTTDKYGNVYFKKVGENAKGDNIVRKRIKIWRKCTLIAGTIVRDWGELNNMVRSVDDISETKSSYSAILPDFINYTTVSMVQLLKDLQKFKNMVLYNLQLAVNRAGTKGIYYDTSQLPDGWTVERVMNYLKGHGVAFYNSYQNEVAADRPPFFEFDLTISQTVQQYMGIVAMIEGEMDKISGVNEARQGIIDSDRKAVGVMQNQIIQSSMNTGILFREFEQFEEDILNHIAGLIKICWTDKERFAPIIGDAGIDFIKNDIDLSLDDYAVFVNIMPPMMAEKQELKELIMAAMQAGQIQIDDAVDLLFEKDFDTARIRLRKTIQKRRDEAQQQQMQMQMQLQQQQADNEMRNKQAEMQTNAQQAAMDEEAKQQRQLQVEDQRHKNKLQQDYIQQTLQSRDQNRLY